MLLKNIVIVIFEDSAVKKVCRNFGMKTRYGDETTRDPKEIVFWCDYAFFA